MAQSQMDQLRTAITDGLADLREKLEAKIERTQLANGVKIDDLAKAVHELKISMVTRDGEHVALRERVVKVETENAELDKRVTANERAKYYFIGGLAVINVVWGVVLKWFNP